jgi:hypothetical protein
MKIMSILCIVFICIFPCFSEENDPYVFTVGKITVSVPNDYFCAYWDGIRNERVEVDNKEKYDPGAFNKDFFIIYFRKDSNFEDPAQWGYGASNLPVFTDYVNGVSETKPKFFVETMRRNKFKGINICETLTLGWYEIYNKTFSHQIIFTDDEYFYSIKIGMLGDKFEDAIETEMPDYFTDDGHGIAWINGKRAELRDKFNNYQLMPKYINDLFEESNNIFNNIIINE